MSEITINLHDIPCGNCTVCIGRTIGAKHEKERIIKLLDALKETRPTETNTNYWGYSFERIIALIKGEN